MTKLPHVGATLPKTWVEVRQALENDHRNYMELAGISGPLPAARV